MKIFKKHELLALIKPYLPQDPIIVEAGAFDGSDTKKNAQFFAHATIHAFEPVPEIFQLLTNNTHTLQNVFRYQVALSDHTGSATFHVSEKPSRPGKPFQAGSLHEPKERLRYSDARYTKTISVPTSTLDDWAKQNAIDHVDFLWLDAQGHELAILQGAAHLLTTVRVIYTEVQFIHAYENQPLYQEVKTWIESQGFVAIAKDFTKETDWFFGNVVFVKASLL